MLNYFVAMCGTEENKILAQYIVMCKNREFQVMSRLSLQKRTLKTVNGEFQISFKEILLMFYKPVKGLA